MIKTIIAAGVVLVSGILPVIPQGMTLRYAYQYPAKVTHPVVDTSTTTSQAVVTPDFSDDDGNGIISVAVFADANGNLVYEQIPDALYGKMGQLNGYASNPTKDDFVSALSLAVPQVNAAVTFDSLTNGKTPGATSLTYAFTNTAGDLIVVCTGTESGNTVSGVTYNSVTLSNDIGSATNVGSRIVNCKSLDSPSTGANNVVVSYSASVQSVSGAISFSGVNGAAISGLQTEIGTITNFSLTVACTVNGIVVDALETGNRTLTYGGGQTLWYNDIPLDLRNGGSYAAGAASVAMTEVASSAAEGAHVAFCVNAGTAPASPVQVDDQSWFLLGE